jgi:pilus assembly protein Flp/PilA
MRAAVKRFFRNRSGATAIEYGLIAALIVLAILGGMTAFANATTNKYDTIEQNLATNIG